MAGHIPRSFAQPQHVEHHFTATAAVRDVVIGMSDGLTVPFALAAGISGAIASSHIVVTAGIAELAAGGISMGLGGYLAARTDVEHYESEELREETEVQEKPAAEEAEVFGIFRDLGLSDEDARKVTAGVTSDRKRWIDFMMRFELGLEKPDQRRAPVSAATIGASYVIGGLVPLAPYMFIHTSGPALYWSCMVTFLALAAFGGVKGSLTGVSWLKSAVQTVIIGGVAATAAFLIARWVSG